MPAEATSADALRVEKAAATVRMLHAVGTISGVAVAFVAARNEPGTGYLAAGPAGTTLAWKAPGSSTFGTYVDVSAGGTFVLEDGEDADMFVRVIVTATRLPSSAAEGQVLLQDVYENEISSDDVTAAEALAGDISTFTVDVQNDSPDGVPWCLVWVDAAVTGIEISTDGISWSTPTNEASAIDLGPIAAAASVTLHLRRTIGAAAANDPAVLTELHMAFESWSG